MNAPSPGLAIRPAVDADTPALHDVCLRTADAGKDGTALFSDAQIPGYIWSVPYARFEPDFAFVLDNGERAIGYVVAAPDTKAFLRRLDAEWWPKVRQTVADLKPSRPLDAMALSRIAHPEPAKDWLTHEYPAHLHINVLPDAQSSGWGKRMIETELATLRDHGVPGVHLGVSPTNERAMGFYSHLGFERIDRDGHVVFTMKLRGR
ncbi:GNAT family N-acetyltransferase [Jiella mangrovi]|uniref:GNAT family N-acetyltransferase n=1 Tax=Jiella mangrovi TaxID=2821407 RepID=A0ABS4BGD3_9HYPH|nr:N-acetyltransferase [Jiella mangrovi]MBP0615809.1 GNAT family N-acetyltransferase [Jiella mangrovi]